MSDSSMYFTVVSSQDSTIAKDFSPEEYGSEDRAYSLANAYALMHGKSGVRGVSLSHNVTVRKRVYCWRRWYF